VRDSKQKLVFEKSIKLAQKNTIVVVKNKENNEQIMELELIKEKGQVCLGDSRTRCSRRRTLKKETSA
jgi:hypothetical protein